MEELLSTQQHQTYQTATFLPIYLPFNKNSEHTPNHYIPQSLHPYLSGPASLVKFTAPNKESLSWKSVFKSLDHVSSSLTIKTFT